MTIDLGHLPHVTFNGGIDVINGNPALSYALRQIIDTNSLDGMSEEHRPERGSHSVVYKVGRYAIKLSTPEESRASYRRGGQPMTEDLMLQAQFMEALRLHLVHCNVEDVVAPMQYAAVQLPGDHSSLMVSEYMSGFSPLPLVMRGMNPDDRKMYVRYMDRRIKEAIGSSVLRLGLNDGLMSTSDANTTGNILVERTEERAEPRIAIIDQPGRGKVRKIMGSLAVNLDRVYTWRA